MSTNYTWPLPGEDKLTSYAGMFAAVRKHDIHTGVDCYCNPNQQVVAMEDGVVVAIEEFTGENANLPSPWWNNTKAVFIEGKSGVFVYGEISPMDTIKVGKQMKRGQKIGHVITVLKKDKGIGLPITMLHLELYKTGTRESVIWNLEQPQPEHLIDPMPFLNASK